MKKVTFSCLTLATLLQLIPSNGNAANIQVNKKKTNRTEMKQDTIPANSTKKESEEGERNVMLNASDANKPREIQIGLPSEDVNVYENGLPAVYSSTVHKLAAHRRSDSSLGEVGLLSQQTGTKGFPRYIKLPHQSFRYAELRLQCFRSHQ